MSMEVDQESNKRKIDEVQRENEEEKKEKPEEKRQRTEELKVIPEHEPEFDKEQVLLDWYGSDVNLKLSEENYLEATWEESSDIKIGLWSRAEKYLLRVGWSVVYLIATWPRKIALRLGFFR